MGRNLPWSGIAEEAAGRAGFTKPPYPLLGQAFYLGGEVSPSVLVGFQRVAPKTVAPEVAVGVYIEPFEREWLDRLLRTDSSPEYEGPAFGLHGANVRALRPRPWCSDPPSAEDIAALGEWFDRAFEYAKRLPSSMDSLVAAIEANRIADHDVGAYHGHPVKVRGFVDWLRRARGVDLGPKLLPLLPDRTEPYDVNVMLGDGLSSA